MLDYNMDQCAQGFNLKFRNEVIVDGVFYISVIANRLLVGMNRIGRFVESPYSFLMGVLSLSLKGVAKMGFVEIFLGWGLVGVVL